MYKSSIREKFLLGVLLSGLAACSYNTPPDKTEHWHIEYRVSGGFAGKIQGLDLSDDGHYTVFDRRRGTSLENLATSEQLDKISNEITRLGSYPEQGHSAGPDKHRCADCLTRQVNIQFKQRLIHYRERSGVAGNASYRVISGVLSTMLAEGLAAAGKPAEK